jgi:phosphopantetheinyl transferase
LVEIGRRDLAAIAADVRIAHVISHDQDDVGSFGTNQGEAGCDIQKERFHDHSIGAQR